MQRILEREASVSTLPAVSAPAAESLTDLQSAFIDAYIQLGGDAKAAALECGYGEGGAANIAMRNLAKPKIQAEIVRRLKLQAGSALAVAVGRLLKIIETSEDDRAAVQAALGIMDRFGMAVPKGPLIDARTVNVSGSDVAGILAEVAKARQARLSGSDDA